MTDTPQHSRIGEVLGGRYRITELLGEGGMGVVYRGERVQLARPVAIKFLHSPYARSPKFVSRFEREARAMSKLSHPHCVSVIDFGMHEAPYIVMDFVTGSTLRDALDKGPISVARALSIVRQVLLGLSHAHGQGIIHRDVKPANIMLGEATGIGDHVRIFDFGLAKLHDAELEGDPSTAAIVGTPAYMAPEQARAEKIDARADLYATGVVLFELLTGQKPFQAGDAFAVLCMQRDEPPPRLRSLRPDLSSELDAVLACALEKNVDKRFQTAAEFIAALEAVPEAGVRPSVTESGTLRDPMAFAKTQQLTTPSSASGAAGSIDRAEGAAKKKKRRPAWWAAALVLAGVGGWLLVLSAPRSHSAPAGARTSVAEPASGQVARDGMGSRPSQPAKAPEVAAAPSTAPGPGDGAASDDERGPLERVLGLLGREPTDAQAAAPADDAGVDMQIEQDDLSEDDLAAADQALDEGVEAEVKVAQPSPKARAVRTVAGARALVKAKRYDDAIAAIRQLRRKHARSAELPFLLGEIYFERGWWSDALAKYREAIRMSSGYRKRASLQRNAIRALGDSRTYPRARALLVKDVRHAALPRLRSAYKRDPSALVRRRARAVIAQITR